MNKDRRKRIAKIVASLRELDDLIVELAQEEQDAFDAMPEPIQNGDRGEACQNAISKLEEATLDYIIECLEEAAE